MSKNSSSGNLESQAAQLLIQLHVTDNPAFAEVDGFHDEELLMRADALGVAARGRAEAKRRSTELLSQQQQQQQMLNSPAGSFSNNSFYNNNSFDGAASITSGGGPSASLEVEQFRAALRQQRVPSLRLLTAVARTSIPALLCVVCNAQHVDNVDDFVRGGRFDSLYYDAVFKNARHAEKRREAERASKREERRHCTFMPWKKDKVAEQFLAFKRGLVKPGEDFISAEDMQKLDDAERAEMMKRQQWVQQLEQQQQQNAADQSGDGAAKEEGKEGEEKKEGEAAAAQDDDEDDPLEQVVRLEPDAFFKYNMEWKRHKEKKLEKKVDKLKKERAEEDEETFRKWHISQQSRRLAKAYNDKKENDLLPVKAPPLQFTHQPKTTPFRSKRAFVSGDVLERMQMDETRRKAETLQREVRVVAEQRAVTPKVRQSRVDSVVKELYKPSPRKTPTFRQPVVVETPTFSPKIGKLPASSRRAETPNNNNKKSTAATATESLSHNRHVSRCLVDWEEEARRKAVPVAAPMSREDAKFRFRCDTEALRERERRLQDIRDNIERRQNAACTFRPETGETSPRLTSRYYGGLEDEMSAATRSLLKKIDDNNNGDSPSRPRTPRRQQHEEQQQDSPRMSFRTNGPIAGSSPLAVTAGRRSSPPRSPRGNQQHAESITLNMSSIPRSSVGRRRGAGSASPDSRVRRVDFSPPRLTPKVSPPPPQQSSAVNRSTQQSAAAHGRYHSPPSAARPRTPPPGSSNKKNPLAPNHRLTFPHDHQVMLSHLSDVFRVATDKLPAGSGALLPLPRALELVSRVAVQKRIVVRGRLLSWDDASCIFATAIPFADFVRLFELFIGQSVLLDDDDHQKAAAAEEEELDL